MLGCEPSIPDPYKPDPPSLPVKPTDPFFKADAGPDLTVWIPKTTVTLDATASQDTGRIITLLEWKNIQGGSVVISNPKAVKTDVSGLHEGIYLFELKATGKSGATSIDTVKVTVVDEFAKGVTPSLFPYCDTLIHSASEVFHILGAGAFVDSGGLRYDLGDGFNFSQLSGPSASTLTPSSSWPFNYVLVKNTVPGQYVFRVEVARRGLKASDTIVLQVLTDTAKGKEYQYETSWRENINDTLNGITIVADVTSVSALLLNSAGRETKVWISEDKGVSWTFVSDDNFFSTLAWWISPCNSALSIARTNNADKSAVGKKVLVKIQIVK